MARGEIRRVLAELLPAHVEVVQLDEIDAGLFPLQPLEATLVAPAHSKRRLEFAAGRACARAALSRLGQPNRPILVGPDREPQWPPGVVGSITHCPGFCAAAVGRQSQLVGLGIDAESNAPLPDGVQERVCLPHELAALPDGGEVSWPAVLFSARESIFKTWYPITRRWLDFHDVELRIDLPRQRFRATLRRPDPRGSATVLAQLRGSFAWTADHVVTAAWIRREVPGSTGHR